MASKPLSNDEAKELMKQLGIADTEPSSDEHAAKKGSAANNASVSRLLSELYRSDVGRWPRHITRS